MSAKLIALTLILIILGSSVALIARVSSTRGPTLNLDFANLSHQISQFLSSLLVVEEASNLPLPSPIPSAPSDNSVPSVSPQTIQSPKSNQPVPARPCYRFTIPGGSPKCYSQADYNQLVNLSYELSSAQTFYNFHLEGVARYQEKYEKTGSSIYLDAKASSQAKADAEKAKIDQIAAEMYNIGTRGY